MIGLMKITGRKTVKGEKTSAPKKATSKVGSATVAKAAPSHEEIAKRSYELFLERGGEHGHDADDWARAEAELKS
jgi:hypothetical protein